MFPVRLYSTGFDTAKGTSTSTRVSHNHNSGGRCPILGSTPALANVGRFCLFTDSGQSTISHCGAQILVILRGGGYCLEPTRFWENLVGSGWGFLALGMRCLRAKSCSVLSPSMASCSRRDSRRLLLLVFVTPVMDDEKSRRLLFGIRRSIMSAVTENTQRRLIYWSGSNVIKERMTCVPVRVHTVQYDGSVSCACALSSSSVSLVALHGKSTSDRTVVFGTRCYTSHRPLHPCCEDIASLFPYAKKEAYC
jgi:hypothetical protein